MTIDVIFNPHGRWPRHEQRVRALLDGAAELRSVATRGPGDAADLARRAADEGRRVVAAGGDGTLNEVINGLAPDFEAELGVLPLGTGNDFYRAWGDPDDLEAAVAALRAWNTVPVDVAYLEDEDGARRHMINTSTGGFSTTVGERLRAGVKENWGALAYTVTAAEVLPEMCSHRVVLTLDDEEAFEVEALNVLVANGRFVGGGVPVAPAARFDDGLLDLVVVREAPMAQLLKLLALVVVGDPTDDPAVIHRRAKRIGIRADPPIEVNADGEAGFSTPVTYGIVERAVRFAVPGAQQAGIAAGAA